MTRQKSFILCSAALVLLFSASGSCVKCLAEEQSESIDSAPHPVAKEKVNSDTAKAVNQIPGVKVKPTDLKSPDLPPITGFHPVKKLLRPVENLEGMSIRLEQQMMRLGGPVAALHPPMLSLDNKMSRVKNQLEGMQSIISSMQSQISGVRSDVQALSKEIAELKQPLVTVVKPLSTIGTPLTDLSNQLNYILIAITLACFGVIFGTPFAAILVYRNRRKMLAKTDPEHDSQPRHEDAAIANKP